MLQQVFPKLPLPSLVSLQWSSPLFKFTVFTLNFSPPSVGAAYEGVQKRTFLAMSIVIASQVSLMLILVLLYHKLGQLREQQIHVNATEPLLSNTLSSNQDGASDKEDATEMSELLSPEKNPLEDSGN